MGELIEVIRKAGGGQGPVGQAGAVGPMGPPGTEGLDGEEGPPGAPAGPHNIDSHTDVDTISSAPTLGDLLTWDGTSQWVPQAPSQIILKDEGVNLGGISVIDFRGSGVSAKAGGLIEIPGPPVFFPEDGEVGESGPPGPQGVKGDTGVAGSLGAAGPAVFLVGEDGEAGEPGPPGAAGAQGSAGGTGSQGPMGPAVFLVGEDGLDGEVGPVAPSGALDMNAPGPLFGRYAPGGFNAMTGRFAVMTNHLILNSSQRVVLQGTARLSIYT